MYKVINQQEFIEAFDNYGRGDQFSYKGLCRLWDLHEDIEETDGEPVELDVIAICCDFTEMSWDDVLQYYSNILDAFSLKDNAQLLEWLEENTFVVYSDKDRVLFKYNML